MKKYLARGMILLASVAFAQNPYGNQVFGPVVMTATSQTSNPVPLGNSWSSGTITLTGTSLTTATFGVLASTDNGTSYFAYPICTVAATPSCATTQTATANGVYQINLANVTHIKYVTSGTFTGTSISLLLTASPNSTTSRVTSGGSGGATFPGTPGVVYGLSSTTSRAATGQDLANAAKSINSTSVFMTDTPPTSPGTSNVSIGVGVDPNLSNSSGFGDANVDIGYFAGHSRTTSRSGVFIGPNAGWQITGNGTGPDDMLFVLIGNAAGFSLTNAGCCGIMIGEDSGVNATNSNADVFVGIHSGANVKTSSENTLIGHNALSGDNIATYNGSENVFVGANSGGNAVNGSTVTQNVAVGNGALANIATANRNVAMGYAAGGKLSTGSENVFLGYSAGYNGANVITGQHNVILGASAGSSLTSGDYNFIANTGGDAVSSAGDNFIVGRQSGANIATQSGNVNIGYQVNRGGDTRGVVAMGINAATSNSVSNLVAIGTQAGTANASGTGNTYVGNVAGVLVHGSNNTAFGDTTLASLTGAESNDTAIGAGADIATGISGAGEFGPGQCTSANAFCFKSVPIMGTTKFSVTGCGTATSLIGQATAGQFTGGSATCTPVVTMGVTAPNGFSCHINDQTTATALFQQSGDTTTTATFTSHGVVGATDVINFGCDVF